MADVTWTQEQLAAITARNPGILVSAGAGSGKTAVLTERVVQRIFDPLDPVDADRMLIVTFTRAAAEEMRERIAVKLRAVQREHPEDSSVARQLILLEITIPAAIMAGGTFPRKKLKSKGRSHFRNKKVSF